MMILHLPFLRDKSVLLFTVYKFWKKGAGRSYSKFDI